MSLESDRISSELFSELDFLNYVLKHKSDAKLFTQEIEGGEYTFLIERKGPFTYTVNLPFGLYLGTSRKTALIHLLIAAKRLKSSQLTLNFGPDVELDEPSVEKIAKDQGFDLLINKCHMLDTQRHIDDIFGDFNSTRKKHIRRYQKAHEIQVFKTRDVKYFKEYFVLYKDSANRWGTSMAYSQDFIEGLVDVPGIFMWVAVKNGDMLSGMICMYYEDHVFDWLAASIINTEVKKLYAAAAVQYEVIKDASERGMKWVNMGASKNLEGVSDFKDSWGAEERNTYTFMKRSFIFGIMKKLYGIIRK